MKAMASVAADAPLPVEAGKAQVSVTVSGSIRLR
jgi:predicted secreted protein